MKKIALLGLILLLSIGIGSCAKSRQETKPDTLSQEDLDTLYQFCAQVCEEFCMNNPPGEYPFSCGPFKDGSCTCLGAPQDLPDLDEF